MRINRLHQIDFDAERARADAEDVLVHVFAFGPIASRALETEEIHPEFREPCLVGAAERNLLHPENSERSRLGQ